MVCIFLEPAPEPYDLPSSPDNIICKICAINTTTVGTLLKTKHFEQKADEFITLRRVLNRDILDLFVGETPCQG